MHQKESLIPFGISFFLLLKKYNFHLYILDRYSALTIVEMKRVVNTILQLFDFVSQDTIIIAATNQLQMIDEALIRRFDLSIKIDLPNSEQIHDLIQYTIKDRFVFDNEQNKESIINSECKSLSYYVIKRTLLNAIKRNILDGYNDNVIRTDIWRKLLNDKRIG